MSQKQHTVPSSKNDESAFWQMVFETFRSSGLTVRQFCKNEGITESAFYSHRKKLLEGHYPEHPATIPQSQPPGRDTMPKFTQIAQLSSSLAAVRIDFPSGVNVHISNGCDNQLLRETIKNLQC